MSGAPLDRVMSPAARAHLAARFSHDLSAWFAPRPQRSRAAIDAVRVYVAFLLATHPLHALRYPDDARVLSAALGARGVPLALEAAWLGFAIALVAAVALVTRRFAFSGAVAASVVVLLGGLLLHAPRWYVVGGLAEDGAPGVELHVLLLGCLAGVLWSHRPSRLLGATTRREAFDAGLEVVRVASAFALVMHGAPCFVLRDVQGMRAWGDAMGADGWPCAVALVWSIKSVELAAALLRLARRLVVPACLAHLTYLVPGLWISHRLRWFDVGPGEGGIEFPLLIVVCSIACVVGYWPHVRPRSA